MGLFSFGSRRKPKQFGFKPRYYDEEQEEREKRLSQIKNSNDVDAAKDRIRSGLRSSYRGDAGYKKSETRKANMRLVMIIIALVLAAMVFLRSNTLAEMLRTFEG